MIWVVYAATWTGNYEAEDFEQSPLQTMVFVFCSLTMSVVSLNLLIAIIQHTHTRVRASGTMAFYKELADLLLKIERMVPERNFYETYLLFSTRRYAMLRGASDEEEEEAMEEALLGVDDQNLLRNVIREANVVKTALKE